MLVKKFATFVERHFFPRKYSDIFNINFKIRITCHSGYLDIAENDGKMLFLTHLNFLRFLQEKNGDFFNFGSHLDKIPKDLRTHSSAIRLNFSRSSRHIF